MRFNAFANNAGAKSLFGLAFPRRSPSPRYVTSLARSLRAQLLADPKIIDGISVPAGAALLILARWMLG